jgi:hypothetical protein
LLSRRFFVGMNGMPTSQNRLNTQHIEADQEL